MTSEFIWFVYTKEYIYIHKERKRRMLKKNKQLLAVHISNLMFDINIKKKWILWLKIMIYIHVLWI